VKGERPSRTAHLVALGRAMADAGISHVASVHDPTARVFLSDKGRQSLAKTEHAAREGKRSYRLEMARGSSSSSAPATTGAPGVSPSWRA
jgi:hypothetical protein